MRSIVAAVIAATVLGGALLVLAPAAYSAQAPVSADAIARCAPLLAAPEARTLRTKTLALLAERGVRNRATWADAVLVALCAAHLPLGPENMAFVLAQIERESGFHPHGLLPNPPDAFRKLAYRAIDDLLAAEVGDLQRLLGRDAAARFVARTVKALQEVSLLDRDRLRRTFDEQDERFGWSPRVSTEWDVENLVARDLLRLADEVTPVGLLLKGALAWEPRWRSLLSDGRLFRSVGPLQVAPEAAVALAAETGTTIDARRARALLYTIEGGVYYGVHQLRPVIAFYSAERPLTEATAGFVAADWRQGFLYACRDAAVVAQVARLAGRNLPPGTALRSIEVRLLLLGLRLTPDRSPGTPVGATDAAAHVAAVDALLAAAGNPGLEKTALHAQLRQAYQARFGEEAPTALVPDLRYASAKTGRYGLRDVVDDTRRRFAANCARLGCRP